MNSNDRWIWLGLSIGLSILTGWLRAFLLHMARDREDDPLFQQLGRIVQHPWLIHPVRLLYSVGIPALALFFSGALTTRGLGLKPLPPGTDFGWETSWAEWMMDGGWLLLMVVIVIALVLIGDSNTRKATGVSVRYHRDLGVALREAVYHQAHWAFYREPLIFLAGWQTGAVMGMLPVVMEQLLSPALWQRDAVATQRRDFALRLGLLSASALLYMLTQNVWMSLLMDVVVMLFVGGDEELGSAE